MTKDVRFRSFQRVSLAPKAVPIIIAVNVLIFLAWNFPVGGLLYFMVDHFLVSWSGLLQGRIWTLLTSAFSHNMFLHILINMYVLNSFGSLIEAILGVKSFVRFYLMAGILSSLSHALVSALILGQPDTPALGASGAVSGVILIFSFMFPKEKILIFGLIPVPALWGALGFIGLDVWGLIKQAEGGGLPIGHGAHIGGALCGIAYYYFFIRSRREKNRPLI